MLKYTPKFVGKWVRAPENVMKPREPKPFPGKAPTRMMISSIVGDERFDYFGKPSLTMWNGLKRMINKPLRDVEAVTLYAEFDRGGVINMTLHKLGEVPISTVNSIIWAKYHPELMWETWPNWLRYKYKVVKGVYKIA